jgi:hypothetical protein
MLPAAFTVLGLLVSCGNNDSGDSGYGSSPCHESQVSLDIDDVGPEGVSGRELVALIDTPLSATFEWQAGPPNSIYTMTVEYSGGQVIYYKDVDNNTRHVAKTVTADPKAGWSCGNWLQVEVDVAVALDDGTVDEEFVGQIKSVSGGLKAELEHYIDTDALSGSLSAENYVDVSKYPDGVSLKIRNRFLESSMNGYLELAGEKVGVSGEKVNPLGSWQIVQ